MYHILAQNALFPIGSDGETEWAACREVCDHLIERSATFAVIITICPNWVFFSFHLLTTREKDHVPLIFWRRLNHSIAAAWTLFPESRKNGSAVQWRFILLISNIILPHLYFLLLLAAPNWLETCPMRNIWRHCPVQWVDEGGSNSGFEQSARRFFKQ